MTEQISSVGWFFWYVRLPARCLPSAGYPRLARLASLSHPELGQEVPCFKNSGHPDQDERQANPVRFHVAIADETEQRVGDKNDPSDRSEKNQCEQVIRATVRHKVVIKQRSGDQGGAYESARESKAAWFSAHGLNLWSCIHVV
jgi:hypothetical protein